MTRSLVRLIALLLVIGCFGATSTIIAQPVLELSKVSQIFRNIAVITDTTTIKVIFDDYLIPEFIDETEKVEIIDIGGIGFGSNDILIVYPSLRVYMLENPSPDVANVMRNWNITELRRDASNELDADYFYPAFAETLQVTPDREIQRDLVQNAIISDILESLERNYKAKPISLRFERDGEGFTFQIWNHEPDSFAFTPRPKTEPGRIGTTDFLYLLYRDSSIIAEDTLTDVIFFNRTVNDSIYMPPVVQREFMRVTTECEVCVNIFEDVSRRLFGISFSAHAALWQMTSMRSTYDPGIGAQLGFIIKPSNYFLKINLGASSHAFRYTTLPDDSIDEPPLSDDELPLLLDSNMINAHGGILLGFNWRSSKTLGGYFGGGTRINRFISSAEGVDIKDGSVSIYAEGALKFGRVELFLRQSLTSSNSRLGYREYGLNLNIVRSRRNYQIN